MKPISADAQGGKYESILLEYCDEALRAKKKERRERAFYQVMLIKDYTVNKQYNK